jgi:hypothetical protein
LARWKTKEKVSSSEMGKNYKSKKKGGLEIKDLKKMNISLLCKWWWRLENNEGIWQNIFKLKR